NVADIVNENPVIVSDGGGDTATLSVAENSTAITTVTATDPAGAPVHYQIAGGLAAGAFQIDATTGALSFTSAPDFESPRDSGLDNSYEVIVAASNGTGVDRQTITVNVTDANDAPVITSGNLVLFPENSTAAITIEAHDDDPGTTLQYF